ncbi:methylmalonyl-CoA epimerase [Nocardia sp. NPDC057455]|uniref:methylmalonyl-CoA epimerase n=1 Tax=Nocardia sp. NPDC057455 TaxID=3346138 RepID=UPI00366A612B
MSNVIEQSSFIPADYVTAVDHVGIAVPDLDAAVTWYAENLGMVETHREINEAQGVHEAMLSLPGAPDRATALQLLAPLNAESTIAKFIDRNGPGLQQLAYRVTDIEAVSAYLRAKGLRLLYEAPRHGTADSRINFIHPKDAGGVLIELVEPNANVTH